MSFFDTKSQRAAWLVAILGVGIFIALVPFASGLLGAPVLYVVFAKMHERLSVTFRSRAIAATVVIVVAMIGIVVPLVWMVSLLVGQAQGAAQALAKGLETFHPFGLMLGPQLKAAGTQALSFVGGSAISFLGTATRLTLNLLFTFFGLYYLLMDPKGAWDGLRPYIPFSDENVDILRERFIAVTKSTIVGTGFAALVQGILVALAFQVTGLGNAMFWGAVTMVLSILPVVGGGLVWGPGALILFSRDQAGMAVAMLLWGLVVVSNVDNFIRPYVASRYAQIHPLITLVGAVGGVSYMGILGLLVGPLALSYFFELLSMYQREYLTKSGAQKKG